MSSVYSSRRSSLGGFVLHATSKSVPVTPAIAQHRPVFRTVPETPKHNRLLSDDHGVDIEILTHKLQLYQLEIEEAELRLEQRKSIMRKQAADVAAAARFRNELEKIGHAQQVEKAQESPKKSGRSRSTSGAEMPNMRTSTMSLRESTSDNLVRSKRPEPLQLSQTPVMPQVVQSALLPTRRSKTPSMNCDKTKNHWRRTTISAGRDAGSAIIMVSSPGNIAEYDFTIPPVPQLSSSASTAASPPALSPLTPLPLTPLPIEDQLRRELETFALQEGPNIQMSRRGSLASRRRMLAAFIPDPDDRLPPKLPSEPESLTALIDDVDDLVAKPSNWQTLGRKKSFFSRFEKKDEVNALLDLYLTEEQLNEEKLQRKSTKLRRHLTKIWHPSESVPQRATKPG